MPWHVVGAHSESVPESRANMYTMDVHNTMCNWRASDETHKNYYIMCSPPLGWLPLNQKYSNSPHLVKFLKMGQSLTFCIALRPLHRFRCCLSLAINVSDDQYLFFQSRFFISATSCRPAVLVQLGWGVGCAVRWLNDGLVHSKYNSRGFVIFCNSLILETVNQISFVSFTSLTV